MKKVDCKVVYRKRYPFIHISLKDYFMLKQIEKLSPRERIWDVMNNHKASHLLSRALCFKDTAEDVH